MQQLFEYVIRHPLLTGATLLVALAKLAYEASRARGGGQAVGPNEAVRLLNQGAVMLDVRPRDQFDAGHVIEAQRRAPTGRGSEAIRPDKADHVLRTGMSGAAAARVLRSQGYTKVANLRALQPGAPRTCHSSAATPRPAEHMSDEVEVLMYSTEWCGYCERARALLKRNSVEFREIKLDEHPEQRETMIERSGGRRTVPQIFLGDRHVGGFEELYMLDKSGDLESLLGRS
jgi:glutaredoxin 3